MIELKHLSKVFDADSKNIKAVNDVSLTIEEGDVFGIIGLSGAGKSTLVRCINYLEKPTGGNVFFNGVDLGTLPHKELLKQRQKMSMIFQNFNLLSQRTALKNVCYPLEILGIPKKEAEEKARKLLDTVGLSDRINSYPAQLSGGQKQRVAIARALATDPQVLLCDEATSALDPNTTRAILSLLKKINTEMGVTIIVITHEMKVVEQICNKVAVIENGEIVEQGYVKDIFMSPVSDIAKELILPKNEGIKRVLSERVIRIAFDGRSSVEPLIANLILECHAVVNILGADTKDIEGTAYGQMLLQLPDDEAAVNRIKAYLDKKEVKYEEV
ncbi:MAG: ATP-binding cassette domain-containing protein [Clostridia bacterium]|nr:ATP-binding cassette domain-containing protein [Clostridia bacterium]